MKKLFKKKLALLIILALLPFNLAYAAVDETDFEPTDEDAVAIGGTAETITTDAFEFIIDNTNSATSGDQLKLQFGASLNQYIQYDISAGNFQISDDIDLQGNEIMDFKIENLASSPETCTSGVEGRMYYDTSDDQIYVCNGSSWTSTGTEIDHTNIVYVDSSRPAQTGEVYSTLATAITYVNTQTPSAASPWVIKLEPGTNAESVTLPFATLLLGENRTKNELTGTITMSNGSAIQGITVGTGGMITIPNGSSGHIDDSDVILDDGGDGIDGTLSVRKSLVDGTVSGTGTVIAYDSIIGVTSYTNAGVLGTYNTSVFNLTDTGTWANYGVAYDTSQLSAADSLSGATTQSAIDELVEGTSSDIYTFDKNNTGSGVNVDLIANQGTDNDGTIRYNATENRWEFSNDGGTFLPMATSGDLATAQMRETGGFVVSTPSFANVDFDVVDIESDSSTIDANSTSDNFTVQEDGFYLITYDFSTDNDVIADVDGQVLLNSTTALNGSFGTTGTHTAIPGGGELSQSFIAELDTSDSITMQTRTSVAANDMFLGGIFTITKLEGVKGDPGPGTDNNTFTIDQDNTGGDVTLRFGTSLAESITWDNSNTEFDISDNLDINVSGEALEIGNGTAADTYINFDDGSNHNFGWDDNYSANHTAGTLSTYNNELAFKTIQSSSTPVTCSSTVAGMQWMDSDTGIVYVCDTSNSRNKWLSISEFAITGGESASCAAGAAPSSEGCTQDIHNGTDANDLGYQLSRDITITGGSFHADVSCTDGSGAALEVADGDNAGVAYLGDILTGCTDANGCSATGTNIDADADDVIRARLDNDCTSGTITDWSSIILFRYRHD